MREWKLNGVEALDVKLEDVMADFDATMLRVFDHFGFTAEQSEAALGVARTEDIRRMDDAAIAERPQIHSRTISKWRGVLSAAQVARFEERHGDLIRELGYEPAGKPSATASDGATGGRAPRRGRTPRRMNAAMRRRPQAPPGTPGSGCRPTAPPFVQLRPAETRTALSCRRAGDGCGSNCVPPFRASPATRAAWG